MHVEHSQLCRLPPATALATGLAEFWGRVRTHSVWQEAKLRRLAAAPPVHGQDKEVGLDRTPIAAYLRSGLCLTLSSHRMGGTGIVCAMDGDQGGGGDNNDDVDL